MADVNEARKSFVRLTAHYTKNGNDFFLTEGTVKPVLKGHVNETIDGIGDKNEPFLNPIEDYQETFDTIDELRMAAAENATAGTVQKVKHFNGIPYFDIVCDDDSYTIYIYDNKIFYRNSDSFNKICDGINRNILCPDMIMYDYERPDRPLDYFFIKDADLVKDLIQTLLICNKIDENVKIKAPKINCNGDYNNSKLYDDALHGDKETREFEDKVEKETQAAGVDNPLAPLQPQQESVMYTDGGHLLNETKKDGKDMKETISYNIGDWVIIKATEMKAQVNNIIYDGNGDIALFTIIASNGIAYDLDSLDEIKPDPLYLDNMPGRVINSQNLTVPRFGEFDIDPETRMARPLQNEKLPDDYHRDLNGKGVYVYVMKDGRKLCEQPYVASYDDIAKSKKIIRVMDESENIHEYDVNKDLDFAEMPYAAVVDSNGKPVRSIQIDPKSYINADENGEVVCKVDGKLTKFPKSRISILS